MSSEEEKLPPHVLIFPFPIQGHLNSMLNLAHIFCLQKLDVTFIVSEFIHRRLLSHTTVPSTFGRHPGFQFLPIPDGLPDDHPRSGQKVVDVLPSVTDTMVPLFRKMMVEEEFLASDRRRPATCMVADGLLTFAADFAEESGIPLIYFRTASVCSFWALFRIPELTEAGEIPFGEEQMDEIVKGVPGTEGFLRRRDLPSFSRIGDKSEQILEILSAATRQTVRAKAAIFNTFEDLEGPIASQIHKHMPVYTIGPLNAHVKSRLMEIKAEASILSGSFWAETRGCLDWLNGQPPKSVIYVSFGSTTVVTREQLMEFWYGLVNSKQRFLWVMRPDFVTGEDGSNKTPMELVEGTEERGYLVEWAPQEEVLNHPAVGAFLTHSGWNSTLESIVSGVPMICWPYFGDQTINSRFVSEIWKIGLDIKDTCDRLIFENAIREVMEVRKDEFLGRAEYMAKLAKKAVSKGGSSYCNMDGLVEYFKSLVI